MGNCVTVCVCVCVCVGGWVVAYQPVFIDNLGEGHHKVGQLSTNTNQLQDTYTVSHKGMQLR